MATRYYTEEAYEQIKRTIEEIDNTDVNPVVDFFGDLFQRIGQFLQLYKVDDYQNDIQKWYNKVLDSHNTTMIAVDSIFDAVDSVDFEYRDIMDRVHTSIVDFQGTLNTLRDVISGKTTLAEGKKAAEGYLTSGKNALNNAYDTLLSRMEKRVLLESLLALGGDVIKLGAGFVGLCVPAPPQEYAVKCKKFLDTFTATLGDLGATTTGLLVEGIFGVGSLFGMDRKNYLDFRFNQLMEAKNYKDTNSVSDWLGGMAEDLNEDLADCPKDSPLYPVFKTFAGASQFASDSADVVDIAVDAYDIVSDLKDTHDNIDKWINGEIFTEKGYAEAFDKIKDREILDFFEGEDGWIVKVKVEPTEFISTVISDRTGIPLSGWDDSSKYDGNVLKTMGTIWSYGEKLLSAPADGYSKIHEIPEVAFGKFKDTKFLKDIFDFARGLDDFARSDPFSSTADSGMIDTMGIGRIPSPDAAGSLPMGPRGGIGEMGGR